MEYEIEQSINYVIAYPKNVSSKIAKNAMNKFMQSLISTMGLQELEKQLCEGVINLEVDDSIILASKDVSVLEEKVKNIKNQTSTTV